jgi:CelD/BcsL family acetyltransferase involved in cellulose biosynthesis
VSVGVMPGIDIEEVATSRGLEALRSEWSDLWARCPSATPFQSPEWLIPWWHHFGHGEPWALALRQGGRLVGLVPLFPWNSPEPPRRRLALIGAGITDYLDGLFAPGFEARGAALVFDRMAARPDRWECCDLDALRESSPLRTTAAPAGWSEETAVQDVCPILDLPDREEDLSRAVPPRWLRRLEYDRRRAGREGPVRFEAAGPGRFEELFEAWLRLHRARWSARGESGMLADLTVRRFHEEAAPALLRAGMLRLYGLRIGDRIAAVYYGLLAKGRAYNYLPGFDPELGRARPGALIVGHAIREAVREGAREFDFLRGGEPYKYEWGAKDRPISKRSLRVRPVAPAAEGGR